MCIRDRAIDGLSRVTNPIVIYQANEAVALNGSYIETGTYNGEVIYGCDESTIRSVAKKYSEQLGSHYFMPVSYTHLAQKRLQITAGEQRQIRKALNRLRSKYLAAGRYSDGIDKVIIQVAKPNTSRHMVW